MQNDVRLQYEQAVDQSHHGHPTIVETIHTGAPGRPAIAIDPDFLRWAYSLRSTESIARFLGLGRSVVRRALLEHGIAVPRRQPSTLAAFNNPAEPDSGNGQDDYLIGPDQANVPAAAPGVSSFTGPLSTISDDELDNTLIRLRRHYRRAGITMFDGMLRRLGHHVPRARIREALIRVDPVQRVFQRISIRRRTYHVPGPNSLWHHDGQHGQIFFFWESWNRLTSFTSTYSLGYRYSWLHRWVFQINHWIARQQQQPRTDCARSVPCCSTKLWDTVSSPR